MITDKQQKFIEYYCETGEQLESARRAGYKNTPALYHQAYKLKRELAPEIAKRMAERFADKAPTALNTINELMLNSDSDAIRLQAAKDMMDRAGYKPKDKVSIEEDKKSVKELEAELVLLVGRERANILLQKEGKEETPQSEGILPNPEVETPSHVN